MLKGMALVSTLAASGLYTGGTIANSIEYKNEIKIQKNKVIRSEINSARWQVFWENILNDYNEKSFIKGRTNVNLQEFFKFTGDYYLEITSKEKTNKILRDSKTFEISNFDDQDQEFKTSETKIITTKANVTNWNTSFSNDFKEALDIGFKAVNIVDLGVNFSQSFTQGASKGGSHSITNQIENSFPSQTIKVKKNSKKEMTYHFSTQKEIIKGNLFLEMEEFSKKALKMGTAQFQDHFVDYWNKSTNVILKFAKKFKIPLTQVGDSNTLFLQLPWTHSIRNEIIDVEFSKSISIK